MALSWTLGIMVLCGKSITIGTFVLPPLLLVIGSSYAIHVLARYYEPTAGCILVDGIDLRRLDLDAWRARLTAAFQDFARFEFLVREAVGIGDLP